MNGYTRIFLLFFAILSKGIFAQAYYTTKEDHVRSKPQGNMLLGKFVNDYPDTSVSLSHQFFPRNFLGNYGLASPDYVLGYSADDLGFRLYPNPLKNDMFQEKDVTYCRSKGPFADLTGIGGSKQLQIFKAFFTHTYKDKVNITLRFNRYTSKGFSSKQQTYTNNFYLSSNYTTKKERFGYYFYYLNNSNRNQENGGLVNDSLTTTEVMQSKDLLSVRMQSAVRENKEHKAMFNPWFKLTGNSDSSNKLNLYVQLRSLFSYNYWLHKDNASGTEKNYFLYYFDTLKTRDSTALLQFTNDALLTLAKGKSKQGVSLGFRNETDRFHQKQDSVFMNNLVVADAYFEKAVGSKDSSGKHPYLLSNTTKFQYVIAGANNMNYLLEDKITLRSSKRKGMEAYLLASVISRNADYIYNNWTSNHFQWSGNGFRAVETKQLKVGIERKKRYGFSVFAQDITNLLYFDDLAYPRQYNNSVQNIGVTTYFNFIVLKHLGIAAENTFQQTSHPELLSLPQNITTARLFLASNLFRNNLQLNLGVQAQVYQSFYSYAYMPATQVFYLQHTKQTATYPFVDIYLNARIRPVTIFVKVENVLQGYAGNDYALVKGYFQPDRSLRFGIRWMFFD